MGSFPSRIVPIDGVMSRVTDYLKFGGAHLPSASSRPPAAFVGAPELSVADAPQLQTKAPCLEKTRLKLLSRPQRRPTSRSRWVET